MLKHDKQGFLVGELISSQREMLEFQQTGLTLWRGIRTDVRSIARFLGARGTNAQAVGPAGRAARAAAVSTARAGSRSAASRPRDSAGRFIAAPRAVSPKRASREEQQASHARSRAVATAAKAAATAAVASRDARGRFGSKGGRGGDGAGGDEAPGLGTRISERLDGIKTALSGIAQGAEQVDPAVAAAHEVKEVVAPLGRGMFAMLGRSAEKKKERWYKRIIAAITGKKEQAPQQPGLNAETGMGIGAIAGGVARMLPLLLTGLGTLIGGGLAAFVGTKIGGAIYEWLDKSGIAAKVFDAFDSLTDWFKARVESVKRAANDFDSARQLARQGIGGAAPVLDDSGRNINDPRRLDVAAEPKSIAATVGRLAGAFQRGRDWATGEGSVPSSSKPSSDNPFKRVLRAGRNFNEIEQSDGSVVRQEGVRAWRNNNPGNIEYTDFAKKMGAIGSDGRFAIFPDYATGRRAKEALIFDGTGGKRLGTKGDYGTGLGYKDKTLTQAIAAYAPIEENNTKSYQQAVLAAVGGQNKRMSQYSAAERAAIMDAMERQEGFKTGKVSVVSGPGAIPVSRPAVSTASPQSVAMAGLPRPAQVSVPSSAPEKMPAPESVTAPPAAPEQDKPVRVVMREPIGQDVGDRQIAHTVSGGIGGI